MSSKKKKRGIAPGLVFVFDPTQPAYGSKWFKGVGEVQTAQIQDKEAGTLPQALATPGPSTSRRALEDAATTPMPTPMMPNATLPPVAPTPKRARSNPPSHYRRRPAGIALAATDDNMPNDIARVEALMSEARLVPGGVVDESFLNKEFEWRWMLPLTQVYLCLSRTATAGTRVVNDASNAAEVELAVTHCFQQPLTGSGGDRPCMRFDLNKVKELKGMSVSGKGGGKGKGYLILYMGYDCRTRKPVSVKAHHLVAWMAGVEVSVESEECVLHHKCGDPSCLNPMHLEWLARDDHERVHGRAHFAKTFD